ncbi:hypothetical protein Csa_014910 [Cucumis sativus]|uniref:Uncharacterized protein n=1 Tax=Cucumis sativus TaxID=3659 RepID=A0A0A0KZ09_CUCSA|nr:hypothetical protein Csa_014910 [Cucumis sativus]
MEDAMKCHWSKPSLPCVFELHPQSSSLIFITVRASSQPPFHPNRRDSSILQCVV